MAAIMLAVFAAGAVFFARTVGDLRTAVRSHCKFDADLGGAPIMVNPATGKPSLLGVTIVSDARVEWHGLGCPGKLPPTPPPFPTRAPRYTPPHKLPPESLPPTVQLH